MTRVLVLLLVLANAAYFAWTQGALKPWGMAPAPRTEPQRAQDQIEPAAVRLLAPGSAPAALPASAPASLSPATTSTAPPATGTPTAPASLVSPKSAVAAAGECLQAGPFTDPQWTVLQDALRASLPSTVWTVENRVEPARWIVYMGRYADAEAVRRKRGELAVLKVTFEPLRNPALEPGLSLGGHPSEAEAKAAMEALGRRGVRTARVVRERDELRSHIVRLPNAVPEIKPQLAGLQAMLAGKTFRACDAPASTALRRPV